MLDSVVPGCGNSDDTAVAVDVSGYTDMWWQNNEYQEGFLESRHVRAMDNFSWPCVVADLTITCAYQGPCEA